MNSDYQSFINKYYKSTCFENPDIDPKIIMNIISNIYISQSGGSHIQGIPQTFKEIIYEVYNKLGLTIPLTEVRFRELYMLYEPFYKAQEDNIINLIPVGSLKSNAMKEYNKGHSVLEYLLAEVIELVHGCDINNENETITVECIRNSINADKELYEMFENVGTLSNKYHRNY